MVFPNKLPLSFLLPPKIPPPSVVLTPPNILPLSLDFGVTNILELSDVLAPPNMFPLSVVFGTPKTPADVPELPPNRLPGCGLATLPDATLVVPNGTEELPTPNKLPLLVVLWHNVLVAGEPDVLRTFNKVLPDISVLLPPSGCFSDENTDADVETDGVIGVLEITELSDPKVSSTDVVGVGLESEEDSLLELPSLPSFEDFKDSEVAPLEAAVDSRVVAFTVGALNVCAGTDDWEDVELKLC